MINSNGGISRFNPITGHFTPFEVDSNIKFSIRNENGGLLFMDSGSNLWFGTNDGLYYLDRETGKYIHYNRDLNDSSSINSAQVIFMLEEGNSLWLGSYYAGLNRLNRKQENSGIIFPQLTHPVYIKTSKVLSGWVQGMDSTGIISNRMSSTFLEKGMPESKLIM